MSWPHIELHDAQNGVMACLANNWLVSDLIGFNDRIRAACISGSGLFR